MYFSVEVLRQQAKDRIWTVERSFSRAAPEAACAPARRASRGGAARPPQGPALLRHWALVRSGRSERASRR